jgi:hypothetical protein
MQSSHGEHTLSHSLENSTDNQPTKMNMCFNTTCKNREVFAIGKHGECDTCGQGTLQFLWQFTSNSQALLTEREFFDKKKICLFCKLGERFWAFHDGPSNECSKCGHSKSSMPGNFSAISQSSVSSFVHPS